MSENTSGYGNSPKKCLGSLELNECFMGHTSEVKSLCWSPDGSRLASASIDKTLRVWNIEAGREERCLVGHTSWITSVSWSPDGSRLADASVDSAIRVWNGETGQLEHYIMGHTGSVNSVSWSPDGSRLVSASTDRTVRVWNGNTLQEENCLLGHRNPVKFVSWSPNGSRLASVSTDNTVRVWNGETGQEEQCLLGHTSWITSVNWSPDGSRLASTSIDKTVRIWNGKTGQLEHCIVGHKGPVYSVSWSPDGSRLASASADKTVRVWNGITFQEEQCLVGHVESVNSVCWSPDGSLLASVSKDKTVRTWKYGIQWRDNPIQSALKWTNETSEIFHAAAKAWGRGDVYSAWKQIEESCQAPWVGEVLTALDLTEATRTQRGTDEEARWQDDRARKIREAIQQKVQESLDPENPPPLEESLPAIERFLQLAPTEDEAIAWLRDSARHTLERQKGSNKEALKVAILGEFSSGKSRLINALLEEKILSVGLVPVTRSVTRIIYGKKIRVTVKHMDGTTVEVDPDQLKAYTDERKKEEGASEVDEVILEHPSPILKQVEIWDTPGFNSNNQLHDQVASQLMLEADAVLWVIAGHQVGSRSETKLLETVKRAQGKVVGVLNQVDRLENEEAIERQKQEVWTHYGEMVKEVVTTSGKWLEEEKPQGNRQKLLTEIEKIGSWSQEQRARKTTRRVAAVAEECLAWFRLKKAEEKTLKDLQSQNAEAGMQQRTRATQLWQEAISHRDQLHKPRKDEEDRWWKSHCAGRTPLTLAYEMLLSEKLSLSEFEELKQCIAVLEEANWHLSPHDPAPWREDFLIAWRQGNQIQNELPEVLYSSDQISCRHKRDLLDDLIMMDQPGCLERHHGSGLETPKPGKITEVVEQISKAPEVEEAWNWALNLKSIKPQQIKTESVAPPKVCGIPGTHLSRNCAPLRRLKKLDQFIPTFEKLQQMVQESYRHLEQASEPIRKEEPILDDQKVDYPKLFNEVGDFPLDLAKERLGKLQTVQKNLTAIKIDYTHRKSGMKETIESFEEEIEQIIIVWKLLARGRLGEAKVAYAKLKDELQREMSEIPAFISQTRKEVWFGYFQENAAKYTDTFFVGVFFVVFIVIPFLLVRVEDHDLSIAVAVVITLLSGILAILFPVLLGLRSLSSNMNTYFPSNSISYSMTHTILKASVIISVREKIKKKVNAHRSDLASLKSEEKRLDGIGLRVQQLESLCDQISYSQKKYNDAKMDFERKKSSLLEQLKGPVVEKKQPSIV